MRVMRLHGISRDAFDRFTRKGASWYYEVIAPGFKYNLTDIAAAMGVVQLARARSMAGSRAAIAARYHELLAGLTLVLPAVPRPGDEHAWHLYVLRLADGAPIGRDAMIARLTEAGIGTSVHYLPLHRHPYWRDRYGLRPEAFPVADAAFEAMFSIPIYSGMGDAEVARVAQAIRLALA
jgi:dTDP-4-amino-4,6-dideoxygalactose transaminase